MLGHTFYHNTIRRYVILFGTLFNDIHINRVDTDGSVTQTIKVPISYGPKEKMLARLDADPNLNRPAIVLPRMSFELTDLNYGPTRKLNTIGKIVAANPNDTNAAKYQYTPVPYDLNFILSIAVKNADDGTRILEQILPFFTPNWNSTVDLIPELGIKLDVPIVLNAVSSEDTYEGNFEERRSIVWTLSFTMKGYIFGPTRPASGSSGGQLIKLANVNFYDTSTYTNIDDAVGNLDVVESITITPGMLANGSPTSNASLSVSSDQINANDNYGYIITKS
jgi:hypothetical protein